jgi:hypothetical protein
VAIDSDTLSAPNAIKIDGTAPSPMALKKEKQEKRL